MSEYEAGRETDALVAEQVMGLRVSAWSIHLVDSPADLAEKEWRPGLFPPDDFPTEVLMADMDGDCPRREMLTEDGWAGIPRYSTDIAAAWEVVEKLRHLDPILSTDRCEWECGFGEGPTGHSAYAPTAPLAICRAALRTTQGDR